MKLLPFFLFGILFPSVFWAQKNAQPNIDWVKTIEGKELSTFCKSAQVGFFKWITSWEHEGADTTGSKKQMILCFDANGQQIWSFALPEPKGAITHIIPCKKGGVFLVCDVVEAGGGMRSVRVVKLTDGRQNEKPAIVWTTDVLLSEVPNSTLYFSTPQTTNGDLILAYNAFETIIENGANIDREKKHNIGLGITKINSDGAVVKQQKIMDKEKIDIEFLGAVVDSKDRIIFFTDYRISSKDSKKENYRKLYIFDQNLELVETQDMLWFKKWNISFYPCLAINDKDQIVVPESNTYNSPLVVLFDTKGNKIWQTDWEIYYKKIGKKDAEREKKFFGGRIAFDHDNNVILVGGVNNNTSSLLSEMTYQRSEDINPNIWVVKIDGKTGEVLWHQEYGGSFRDEAQDLFIGYRNEITIICNTTSYGGKQKSGSFIEISEIAQQSETPPNIYAVLVGVSDYNDSKYGKNIDLRYSHTDAQKIYDFLRSPQGGELPETNIQLLVNEQATADSIVAVTHRIFSKAQPQDLILFYFSGHGVIDQVYAHDKPLSHNALKKAINYSPAWKRLCVLDACHSGSWDSPQPVLRTKSDTKQDIDMESITKLYYKELSRASDGMAIFTSANVSENALEMDDTQQGLFTYYYIEGLKGAADKDSNKVVTISELYQYVRAQVVRSAAVWGRYQTPQIYGVYDPMMPVGVHE